MYGMTNSEDISQPLFSATCVITQWAHKKSSHGPNDGGYASAQQHGLPLTKNVLVIATAEGPVCQ